MAMLKGRWQLMALALLFFVPTLAAMVLVFTNWRPAGFTNNGELVQPAEQLNPEAWEAVGQEEVPVLKGDWLLVVAQTTACQTECRERLDVLNRARVALDRDIERVRLVVLQPNTRDQAVIAADDSADLLTLAAAPAVVAALSQHDGEPMAAHIVDYRGFHVMRYAAPLDAAGLLDDLEKLLRLSKEEAERRALEGATSE
jgi:hypothetical protein